ncbi:hypothetical protein CTAYLR_002292 [Chrysophaeum taylorii]|uniref:S-adenosyl-L-methionine-dependent methyltransferase n=1 Tax=Chrysophaeum taylorii TaxID=2483200 RepID=A0AAD7UNB8_9STRA|nr:hypothetical protein CTAYLR_002292 [Chrysophaeum taylorii]
MRAVSRVAAAVLKPTPRVVKELEMSMASASFVGGTAFGVAYERAVESARDDALFVDPYASLLAGKQGNEFSTTFGHLDDPSKLWPRFHKDWTAVRTHFIDRRLEAFEGRQVVNLGAGFDTRPFRLDMPSDSVVWEVDRAEVNAVRHKFFELLGAKPTCRVVSVDLDFALDDLALQDFDTSRPTCWVAEGLLPWLDPQIQIKLIRELTSLSTPGSVVVLNFLDDSDGTSVRESGLDLHSFETADVTNLLATLGWTVIRAHHFGGAELHFGRFRDGYPECRLYSFVVATRDQ